MKNKKIIEDEPKPIEKKRIIGRSEKFKGIYFKCGEEGCGEEGHRSLECPNVDKYVGDKRVIITNENVDLVNELKQEENLLIQ